MGLTDDLERIAESARSHAAPGELVAAVIPCEPESGVRVYLCAFDAGASRSWLALGEDETPVADRRLVRDTVSVAAMCELAVDVAGGGDVDGLRAQLAELRRTEQPEGIEEAEDAAAVLHDLVGGIRLSSPRFLDDVGVATRRLEQALGEIAYSPFAEAMKASLEAVEGLAADVEGNYKLELA